MTIAWISNGSLLKRTVCRSTIFFRGFCVFFLLHLALLTSHPVEGMGNGLWGKGGEQLQVAEGNVGWKFVEGLVLEIMRACNRLSNPDPPKNQCPTQITRPRAIHGLFRINR